MQSNNTQVAWERIWCPKGPNKALQNELVLRITHHSDMAIRPFLKQLYLPAPLLTTEPAIQCTRNSRQFFIWQVISCRKSKLKAKTILITVHECIFVWRCTMNYFNLQRKLFYLMGKDTSSFQLSFMNWAPLSASRKQGKIPDSCQLLFLSDFSKCSIFSVRI